MRTPPAILSAQAIKRLQGGELILKGYDNDEIADIVGVSVRCINNWRKTLHEHPDDLHSLVRQKGSGRTPRLTDEQKQHLKDIVLAGAAAAGFPDERWTSKRIAAVIRNTFQIEFSASSTRRVLRTLGLSPQMPVVQSHKHSDEAVLEWANCTWKRLKKKRSDSASL
jgi:putative transposase